MKGQIIITETRTWPSMPKPSVIGLPLPMQKVITWNEKRYSSDPFQLYLIGTAKESRGQTQPDIFKWYDAPSWALNAVINKIDELSDLFRVYEWEDRYSLFLPETARTT
jgi:hypothetical protein